MAIATVKEITQRQGRMETARDPYEPLMDWNISVGVPSREKVSNFKTDDKGMMKGTGIWDPTAAASLETWRNGILGWHTPQATNWFQGRPQERAIRDNRNVTKWLQEVDVLISEVLARSNYYEMKGIRLMDSGGIGPSYLFADEIVGTGKIMFRVPHPRQFWHELDFYGLVNKIHYQYELPLREAIRTFGDAWLTQALQTTRSTTPDQPIKIIHASYKNYDYDPTSESVGKNRPWLSYQVSLNSENTDGGTLMEQSGYNTPNPIPWLLNRSTHELYPRGIMGQFIIEIMTSNYMMRDLLMASSQAVRPPLIALDSLKRKMNPKPGGFTWVDKNDLRGSNVSQVAGKLLEGSDWPFGLEMIDRFQSVIEQRFGVPFFLLMNRLEGGEKTATEIIQKQAERAVLMTPFLGTLNVTTDMELDRVFDIEFSAGRIPPPPVELLQATNQNIDIQYTGPLTQLIRQYYEVNKIQAGVASLAFLLEVDPEVAMNMDTDVFAQELLKSSNVPVDGIVPLRQVKEIRAAIAQQNANQQMIENAKQLENILPAIDKRPETGSVAADLQGSR